MTTWQLLKSNWNWEPWVIVLCVALIVSYITVTRFRFTKNTTYFITGVLILLIALVSPLGMLGHSYLFSAHMWQHILLLLIAPLLLLIGIPSSIARKALSLSPFGNFMRVLGHPLVAWLCGIGAMWIWHAPTVYNAALESEGLHIVQQMSLLVMGMIFWLPVFSPLEEWRLTPPFATLYLFSACIGCTILGIIITFSAVGHYPAYLNPVDSLGILPFIRNELYLTPELDQQIGGLIMWVPCCLIYLLASMVTIARWYKTPEVDVNVKPSEPLSSVNSIKASTTME